MADDIGSIKDYEKRIIKKKRKSKGLRGKLMKKKKESWNLKKDLINQITI